MKAISRIDRFLLIILAAIFLNSCEEKPKPPIVATIVVSEITATSAKSGGTISSDGGAPIISCGVCWGTGVEPTVADKKTTDVITAGSFSSNITNLQGGTVYYVRAYATNSAGTTYGTAMSFTTLGQAPTASNATAIIITTTGATLNGSVNANYLSTDVSFEYGTTTSYGSTKDAKQSPLTGNSTTEVTVDLTDLNPGTTYHFRLKAVNSLGTTYSSDVTFVTLGKIPTAVTQSATNITATSVTFHGTVNANYLSTAVTFEYGNTTSYGSTITAIQSPVTGNTETIMSAIIADLTEGTTYYFRIKAVNYLGIVYGNSQMFTTPVPIQFNPNITYGTINDIDGNVYKTVVIGTQTWMAENLKTTKYNDGIPIPNITDNTSWAVSTTGAYCDYNNTPANSDTYGRLYNWYTVDNNANTKVVSNGGKNICPTGWHVSSDAEWTSLIDFLTNNGYGYEGSGSDIAKSLACTSGWDTFGTLGTVGNDQMSNNSSGFTALPSGYRVTNSTYFNIGGYGGYWWSSTEYSTAEAISRGMYYGGKNVYKYNNVKQGGMSVRCIKD